MFDRSVTISSLARGALRLIVRWTGAFAGIFVLTIVQISAQQSFVTIEGDPKTTAWWVIADFQPVTSRVRGIPASRIRTSWCKATEFRKDLIPKELLFEGRTDAMEASKVSFAVDGHFDGSASRQVALVGVYQGCLGQKGRFILILDQPASGMPKIRFVDAQPTDRQFGALAKGRNNSIIAWTCMECDSYSVLKWDRKKGKFGWLPTPEVRRD